MVSESSSITAGSGGGKRSVPRFAYTEKFQELFPYYLTIGMTYEQYWEMDCELVKYYRKAAEIRQKVKNQDSWLLGMYFYDALVDVAPVLRAFAKKNTKPTPYRKEPFPLSLGENRQQRQQREQKSDDKAKASMMVFVAANNKKFQKKGGGANG